MENKFIEICNSDSQKIIIKNSNYIFLVHPQNDSEIQIDIQNDATDPIFANFIIVNKNYNCNLKITSSSYKSEQECEINALIYGFENSNTKIKIDVQATQENKQIKIKQTIIGLLLSQKCKITGEPILKIGCLDAKAEHSLKIGSLDLDELFYLESKGIDRKKAKKIIIKTYLNKLINSLSDNEQENLHQKIEEMILNEY